MIVSIVLRALDFYQLLIVAYVIMSWFARTGPLFEIYRALGSICEPYIGIFRRILPQTGMIDFSPLVALLVLQLLIRPAVAMLFGSLGL